jgi:UDP-N-acetylmuramoyl-tripeptide--D-alanyl-D-alanine ligase
MIPLTLEEIARVVDGTLHGAADPGVIITGPVIIDSRAVTSGALFAAIKGARSDGHDFAGTAYAAGATAVLGTRPVDGASVVVDDVVSDRVGRQDYDEGPACSDSRTRRADRRHRPFLQQ